MKIRSALIITFTAILFLVPAMALGQGPANGALNPSDLTEERPFEIGDRVLILASEHKGRVGEISEILDYSSGTMYVLDGLPHTYPPSDTFYTYDLERIEPHTEFQGIRDLIGFFQQLMAPWGGRN